VPIAVIYIRSGGAAPEQQQRACLAYCLRHGYNIDSVCDQSAEVAALVDAGTASIVVAAYDGDDRVLTARIQHAGGRVEYARPPRQRVRLHADALIAGMYERGASVDTIAHLLDAPAEDIRAALYRAGFRLPPEDRPPPRSRS
jgi:hypothetical protein